MLTAERDVLEAEAKALQTLNHELQRHRVTAEKSLAEARALLARREAALDEERSRSASLDQAFAQARLELEVLLERQRLAPARRIATKTDRRRNVRAPTAKTRKRAITAKRAAKANLRAAKKEPSGKSKTGARIKAHRKASRTRRR